VIPDGMECVQRAAPARAPAGKTARRRQTPRKTITHRIRLKVSGAIP
jgi:hypothetical protein